MWINPKEERIEAVKGHMIHEVRFMGGNEGHLYKGVDSWSSKAK